MDKLDSVRNYVQRQTPVDLSSLDFKPTKTREQFLELYGLHDRACNWVVDRYLERGFTIFHIGANLRAREVMIKDELPNYVAQGERMFAFDAKAKRSVDFFGWVNERAAMSYLRFSRACEIPVYLDFVLLENGQTIKAAHCEITQHPLAREKAWDGNWVWVFNWKGGLAGLDEEVT